MTFIRSRTGKLVAGGVAAIVLAGGGAAVAATAFTSPSARDSAIISDAAGQLGIQPSALSSALTKAIDDQINAAVTAGQLSQSQASALESRLASGDLPLFGGLLGGAGAGGRFGGELSAAATYLGLTSSQIQSDLRGGQTLAQIANSTTGKSSSGLVTALVSAVESNLGSAVSAGKLTSSQEQTIESNLQTRITDLVNGTRPQGFRGGFAPGFRGGRGPGSFGGGGGFGPGPSQTSTGSITN
jgi:hypothetical protein